VNITEAGRKEWLLANVAAADRGGRIIADLTACNQADTVDVLPLAFFSPERRTTN
jgi:hypothetical protein